MINPKELRIGNLVSHYGEIKSVSGTNYLGLIRLEQILDVSENAIDPIPLTPERLERCGFASEYREKLGSSWVIPIMASAKRVLGICNMTSRTLVSFVSEPGNIVMLRPIYHFHDIQNLYFALTGEELTIKN